MIVARITDLLVHSARIADGNDFTALDRHLQLATGFQQVRPIDVREPAS
jgi:hypothetical protein